MSPLKQMITPWLDKSNEASTVQSTNQDAVAEKRAELKAYFQNSWDTYESLFSLINDDSAYFLRPEPLRHPLIFYYGHTATFFINKLVLGKYINDRVNHKLEAICAVGVDEMSWDDLDSRHYDWPSVDEVRSYRKQVKVLVEDLIDSMELSLPITQDSLAWVILMGAEHERIHLETSSVIMRMLDLSYLTPSPNWPVCNETGNAPENKLLEVSSAEIDLAKPESLKTYGWDNEYGSSPLNLSGFNASRFLVSNEEFMAFVDAGGYQKPHYWSDEGQQWLAYKKATMPRFWFEKDGEYWQRNLTNVMPLPLSWPVEVNQLEAKAFCQFKAEQTGKAIRLPSEAQWQAMRSTFDEQGRCTPASRANVNLGQFASSCPVDSNQQGEFYDLVGNVWQWTESAIDGFDGFKVHPLYDDFSTPTFDGKHNLIKGGSWISTGNEANRYSRYAFRRHFFQHAGFRYVESDNSDLQQVQLNQFEENPEICQLIENHFSESLFGVENDSKQLVRVCLPYLSGSKGRLLDIGCGIGRRSFEFAQHFDRVDGVDFSAHTIMHAHNLQNGKAVRYAMPAEGEIVDYKEVQLAQLGLQTAVERIHFMQGDVCNLKAVLADYDVIVAANLLEQTYDPKLALTNLKSRLKSGGYLVLSTNYLWQQALVDKAQWPTGIKVNGENVRELDGLKHILGQGFELVYNTDIHRVIPINKRNFKVDNSQLSIWKKT